MIYMNIGDSDIKESLNAENESWVTETISDSDIYPIEQ
uniref:ORF37 protein n=1 Tax=Enterobacteria phage T4 TaxID=10665 RepID=O36166_BPT4|nr:ORF37 [Tequatrovirus T4]